MSKQIRADQVQKGQTVSAVTYLNRQGRPQTDRFGQHPDIWPKVIEAKYVKGDDRFWGPSSVLLILSDNPNGFFDLAPDDQVTVEEPSR